MNKISYDVIVIGGGHAGVEACAASARMGAKTLLISHDIEKIGEMSCNPAIGGLGKGHLTREVDALDGLQAKIADRACIHSRMLNQSKGPAVQGPRSQADRKLYRKAALDFILNYENLHVVGKNAISIAKQQGFYDVEVEEGDIYTCKALVITSGTYLNGVIHIGDERISAGRWGERASKKLAKSILSLNLPVARLKTGTPARLHKDSINWQILEPQPGDSEPIKLSRLTKAITNEQKLCYITHTTEETKKIIEDNIHLSAVYAGIIEGIGPRYCPSIEDKIMRFAHRPIHQIFLEPEGLDSDLIYPNGISTSLPKHVQDMFLRTIKGLEDVKIMQYGYAIEYDYIDPKSLDLSFMVKQHEGLFLAGQINGTTGYEEAAAQGLLAGANAAAYVANKEPLILNRYDAYAGVLIDDLTNLGTKEPYRMFTSRSEYRLRLRIDNADRRLTPIGENFGLIGAERKKWYNEYIETFNNAKSKLESLSGSPQFYKKYDINIKEDGKIRNAYEILSYCNMDDLYNIWPELQEIPADICKEIAIDSFYEKYIQRQESDINSLRKDQKIKIPQDFNFQSISGLSNELKEKLTTIKPRDMATAARIDGITPAALTLILAHINKRKHTGDNCELN